MGISFAMHKGKVNKVGNLRTSTKRPFLPTLVGEIASATDGTLLKGRGNYKAPRDFPVSDIILIPRNKNYTSGHTVDRWKQSGKHPSQNDGVKRKSVLKPSGTPQ